MCTGILRSYPTVTVAISRIIQIRKCSKFKVSHSSVAIKDKLKTTYQCNEYESTKIERFLVKNEGNTDDCMANLAYLYEKGASMSTVVENLHLLEIPKGMVIITLRRSSFSLKITNFLDFRYIDIQCGEAGKS